MKEDIKEKLKELADLKYLEFHKRLCFTKKQILGVKVPVLRKLAKELLKKYDAKYLLENIDDEYYEEIMLQGIIIGLNKERELKKVLEQIESFIPKIDNWAVCDTFCSELKIVRKYKAEFWKFIQKYLKSTSEFEVRFAVVIILDYYVQQEYLEEIFFVFDNIESDEYYVKMAVAWAISICLIKYYDETKKYLTESKIDRFIYNKALQKAIESYRINDIQKKELRKIKK